jgi:hypothetical protein
VFPGIPDPGFELVFEPDSGIRAAFGRFRDGEAFGRKIRYRHQVESGSRSFCCGIFLFPRARFDFSRRSPCRRRSSQWSHGTMARVANLGLSSEQKQVETQGKKRSFTHGTGSPLHCCSRRVSLVAVLSSPVCGFLFLLCSHIQSSASSANYEQVVACRSTSIKLAR